MSKENKISEEHLVTVKEFTNFFANAKLALGDATLRYETDKTSILSQTKAKDEEFVSFQKTLEESYGRVNINIETGEYTPVEEKVTKGE
jgi:hypothetical protein